jgi:4-aminobutyrate aminotransferase-like enzyme
VARDASVQLVPAPDGYRGRYRFGTPDLGRQYASHVDEALNALDQHGVKPAALIVDTIFSSDGIYTETADYLRLAVDKVRSAGGVFIADEVQPGFGRTGERMWGFERHGVVPDIVTMGKPMGNGHPLSAVVTTRAIIEKFAERARYFNTFGGNPVSCAAGLAVLEVMESEKLQDNARNVGAHLKQKLELQLSKHEIIGDVRGQGLYIGLELVSDRKTREPASREASAVVNGLRDRGVLTGTTGRDGNVLKLRPPLVFSTENADQLIDALDATLCDVLS